MYRVELKAFSPTTKLLSSIPFLMYRVELKVSHDFNITQNTRKFLMYRVELKESSLSVFMLLVRVPNVPCGVESEIPLKGII